jgi:hypothetical protein
MAASKAKSRSTQAHQGSGSQGTATGSQRSADGSQRSATAPRRTTNAVSRGKSGRKPARGQQNTKAKAKAKGSHESIGSLLITLLTMTYFGRVFMVMLATAVVAMLTLLLTHDRAQTFFLAISIELLVVLFVAWLRFALRKE